MRARAEAAKSIFKETNIIICVDFDGTCVTHDYPSVGRDIGAIPVLQALVSKDHQLILFTMRSGNELADAVHWFAENNISLFGINVNPTQHTWTKSPKAYGQLYIDDAALGIPLIDSKLQGRPFVDWVQVRNLLVAAGALSADVRAPTGLSQVFNTATFLVV